MASSRRMDLDLAHRCTTTSSATSSGRCQTGFGRTVARRGRRVPRAPAHRRALRSPCATTTPSWRPRRVLVPSSPCPGGAAGPDGRRSAWSTVHPTHRRRGVLRRMMDEQLDDVAATRRARSPCSPRRRRRSTSASATASPRSPTALGARSRSTPRRCPTADAGGGRVRLVDADAAADVAHDGVRRASPPRTSASSTGRPSGGRGSSRPGRAAHASSPRCTTVPTARPDALRALRASTTTGPTASPARHLRVLELQAVDADVEAALWTYLFGIDLVAHGAPRPTGRSTTRCAGDSPTRAGCACASCAITSGCASSTSPPRSPARTYGTDDAPRHRADRRLPSRAQRSVARRRRAGRRHVRTHRPRPPTSRSARPSSARIYLGGVPMSTLAAAGRVQRARRSVPSRGPTASSPRTRRPGAPRTSDRRPESKLRATRARP